MRAQSILRIRIILALIGVISLVLILRLYQIQVLHGREYQDLAKRQYVHTARDIFSRGSIYMTAKDGEEIIGAGLTSGYLVAINPTEIASPETVYSALQSVVPKLVKEEFLAHASKRDDIYEEVATRVSEADAERIKQMKIKGVHLYQDQWRTYPNDTLAAHAIGFVGYDGDELVGRYGLERYYNDRLVRDDSEVRVNFFAEVFGNLGIFNFESEKSDKGDIITTLEPSVVRTLDTELSKVHTSLKSKLTGGIVMDPKTGEILAMSVIPGFNPNERSGVDVSRFRNPLVEDFYELGSIIKPLTVAAGIDSRAITAQTTYFDSGSLTMDGYTIYNFDKRGRGTVPMQEVLNQSLNTGVAQIVKLMGRKNFKNYFTSLELDTETGIDLPNETHGRLQNLDSPRAIEYATASFGQGIAMTPIEATRALAALGNGGLLVTPHVVKGIRREDGTLQEISQPDPKRVWSEGTSEEISRMLTVVVDTALRKGTKKNPHYSVAAKTGTAQIANPNGGGYFDDRYLHSFFGYFPSYNPRFIVFLYTVEPEGVQYASETLTDPFIHMTEFLINYYALPPDR
jgi:cell division protein FtsI (penicillin-binding protein 3)